jgi:hypothetical protein
MLLPSILATIALILLAFLNWQLWSQRPRRHAAVRVQGNDTPQSKPATRSKDVELLKNIGGKWIHHSWKPEGHPDIQEALDTPGLAIRRDGVLDEGRQ